ncbi:MAG TPA: DUF1697 domain-containing protein [Gemmatimonadota bacterium]|nr:DUF1697 domain-containing protein [Gemmatimonadota bacterium]
MGIHVALLRGINLGNRRLPMKDLAAMFEEAGCWDVRTYIQSGNVVFEAGKALARRIPCLIEESISERFGFGVPIVIRTVDEIDGVVKGNPFLKSGADPKTLHVGFLRDRASKSRVAALDPDRSPPDEFVVRGGEIYLRCPNGVARSKLTTQYFDSRLGTVTTARNWRTVLKLQEMARAS